MLEEKLNSVKTSMMTIFNTDAEIKGDFKKWINKCDKVFEELERTEDYTEKLKMLYNYEYRKKKENVVINPEIGKDYIKDIEASNTKVTVQINSCLENFQLNFNEKVKDSVEKFCQVSTLTDWKLETGENEFLP